MDQMPHAEMAIVDLLKGVSFEVESNLKGHDIYC